MYFSGSFFIHYFSPNWKYQEIICLWRIIFGLNLSIIWVGFFLQSLLLHSLNCTVNEEEMIKHPWTYTWQKLSSCHVRQGFSSILHLLVSLDGIWLVLVIHPSAAAISSCSVYYPAVIRTEFQNFSSLPCRGDAATYRVWSRTTYVGGWLTRIQHKRTNEMEEKIK